MKDDKLMLAVKALMLILILTCFSIGISNLSDSYQFRGALKRASEVPDISWDAQYKSANIKNKYKVILVLSNKSDFTSGEYFKYSSER